MKTSNHYLTQFPVWSRVRCDTPTLLLCKAKRQSLLTTSGDFGPADFGRLSVISDGVFGRCAVNSDA